MTERVCGWCGQPLIESDFNRLFYIYLCKNVHCRLYRERQGLRKKNPDLSIQSTSTVRKRRLSETPNYQAHLVRRRESYRFARSLGFSGTEASYLKGYARATLERLAKEERNRKKKGIELKRRERNRIEEVTEKGYRKV